MLICRNKRIVQARRNASGMFLVEMLIALMIASVFAVVLVQSYSAISVFGSKSQGELLASTIAQEVIDSARDTEYVNLVTEAGVHNLPINVFSYTDNAGQEVSVNDGTVDPIFPRPLLMASSCRQDGGNPLNWTASLGHQGATGNNRFHGTCLEQISVNTVSPVLQYVTIQVWVVWNEAGNMPSIGNSVPPIVPTGCRSYFMQTTISQNGIHS